MSAFTPPGGTLELDSATDKHTSFGVTYEARILRVFAFDSPESARVGREATTAAAKAAGWRMSPPRLSDSGDVVVGQKLLSTGEATIAISNRTRDGRSKLNISIEDVPCPVTRCNDP